MPDRAAIAMRLRAAIQKRWPGYGGQTRAAAALGAHQSQISEVINGRRFLSNQKLVRWAEVLGLKIEDLTAPETLRASIPTFSGQLSASSSKAKLKTAKTTESNTPVGHPSGTFMLRITGQDLARYGMLDGDVLTLQPCVYPESGRFVLVELQRGTLLVGCRLGLFYTLNDPVRVRIPREEVVRVLGFVVQRSGPVSFDLKKG